MHGTGAPLGRYSSEVPEEAKEAAAKVAAVLERAERILVLGHAGADGDVAGSSLALAQALRERGKTVTVYNERPYLDLHAWLVGGDRVETSLAADARFDVTVVVDAADPARCGRDFPPPERRGVFVWMDHHRIEHPPGDLNYIDLTAAAVGEQVAEVLDAMGHPLSKPVAEAIYTSLCSDTGGFRYGNTSARAFRLASRLVAAGVDPWDITQRLYESQPEERVRLLARALSSLWRSPCGRIGIVTVLDEDLRAARATEEHVQGLVNHVRGIRGVEVAILLREHGGKTRAIVRSRGNVSVAPLAERLGGRGHTNAATLVLEGDAEHAFARVLDAATAVVEEALPSSPSSTAANARKAQALDASNGQATAGAPALEGASDDRQGRRRGGGRRSSSAPVAP